MQLKVLETTIALKLPSYGKISVLLGTLAVWLAPAGPAHWEQSGTVSQDGLWYPLAEAHASTLESHFGTGPSPPHRLHSEVYCQDSGGNPGTPVGTAVRVVQSMLVLMVLMVLLVMLGDDGDGTAPLHSPTYCCELKGTHLHQSGRVSSIFTFSPVLADLVFESKTIGCSH